MDAPDFSAPQALLLIEAGLETRIVGFSADTYDRFRSAKSFAESAIARLLTTVTTLPAFDVVFDGIWLRVAFNRHVERFFIGSCFDIQDSPDLPHPPGGGRPAITVANIFLTAAGLELRAADDDYEAGDRRVLNSVRTLDNGSVGYGAHGVLLVIDSGGHGLHLNDAVRRGLRGLLVATAAASVEGLNKNDYSITSASAGALNIDSLATIPGGTPMYRGLKPVLSSNQSIANLVFGDGVTLGGTGPWAAKGAVPDGTDVQASLVGVTLGNADYMLSGGSDALAVPPAFPRIQSPDQTGIHGTPYTHLDCTPGTHGAGVITRLSEKVTMIGDQPRGAATAQVRGPSTTDYGITYPHMDTGAVNLLGLVLNRNQAFDTSMTTPVAFQSIVSTAGNQACWLMPTRSASGRDQGITARGAATHLHQPANKRLQVVSLRPDDICGFNDYDVDDVLVSRNFEATALASRPGIAHPFIPTDLIPVVAEWASSLSNGRSTALARGPSVIRSDLRPASIASCEAPGGL